MTRIAGYDTKQVVLYGVHIGSGGGGASQQPVTFHIDSFTIEGVAAPVTVDAAVDHRHRTTTDAAPTRIRQLIEARGTRPPNAGGSLALLRSPLYPHFALRPCSSRNAATHASGAFQLSVTSSVDQASPLSMKHFHPARSP